MPQLPLIAVVATGRNGAIGRDNALPWHMPTDLARFRALTMGKPMIMGRRTYESIGRALPGRQSVVVARTPSIADPAGVHRVGTPDEALGLARSLAGDMGASEIALIGGAAVFAAFAARIDRLHLTIVDLSPAADTFFATPDPYLWRETARVVPDRREDDDAPCLFLDYERA